MPIPKTPRHDSAPPVPSSWRVVTEREHSEPWSEECQGICGDAGHFYVTSNAKGRQRIYKLNLATFKSEGHLDVTCGHLGALAIHDGYLYAAVEQAPQVFRVELASFMTVDVFNFVQAPEGGSCPWVTVDPRTGYLYSSAFGGDTDPGVTRVRAYRIDVNGRKLHREAAADITLPASANVHKVQGGALTRGGYLLLACDTSPAHLRYFSTTTGVEALPPCTVAKNSTAGEELEGLGYLSTRISGQKTRLHVVLLDNNLLSRDHAIIKHYDCPDLT